MKIGNVGRGKDVKRTKRAKGSTRGSGVSFADKLRGASSAGGTSAVETGIVDHATIDGVDALLAMQEVGDATDRHTKKRAVLYGEDLLDRLNKVQDALLAGGIPKENLVEMAKKLRAGRVNVADDRLNAVLDEIELRVEVEIAKYTRGL